MGNNDVLHVNRHLRLSTPTEELPTEAVWFRTGEPPTVRFLLAWKDWERVASEKRFRLEAETIPTDLVPDNEVVVEARLDSALDVSFPSDEATLRKRLARPSEPLQSTESWIATDVHQRGPLADEEKLTESVFDADDEPRTHAAEITLRPTLGQSSVSTGNTDGRDDTSATEQTVSTTDDETSRPVDVSELTSAESAEDRSQSDDLVPPLGQVTTGLDEEGWSYDVTDDGTRLALTATFEDRHWDVFVTSGRDEWCTLTSVHPEPVEGPDCDTVAVQLLEYNGTVDRGGFELDAETGQLRFRTPFVPAEESVGDAVSENVTAMAEWFDEIRP